MTLLVGRTPLSLGVVFSFDTPLRVLLVTFHFCSFNSFHSHMGGAPSDLLMVERRRSLLPFGGKSVNFYSLWLGKEKHSVPGRTGVWWLAVDEILIKWEAYSLSML